VVIIGETVIANDISTWQNSLNLTTSLLLYDFGARERRIAGARHQVHAAALGQAEPLMQLRYAVLDTYVQGLQVQRRVQTLTEVLARRRQLYRAAERLQAAGTASRVQMEEAALRLAAALTRLDDARAEEARVLAALTELTGDSYLTGQVAFSPLPTASADCAPALVVEEMPQVRALDAGLARLRSERSALLRERLPTFTLSGSWRLYGADRDSAGRTLSELAKRDASVALVVRWEFYSGGRRQLQLAKAEEQLHRLALQRRQRIGELEREIRAMRAATAIYDGGQGNLQQRQKATTTAAAATERLRSEGVLAPTVALEREIELLEDELEAALLRLKQQADVVRLSLWGEGWGS
jgi:outer membrane protein TolC